MTTVSLAGICVRASFKIALPIEVTPFWPNNDITLIFHAWSRQE